MEEDDIDECDCADRVPADLAEDDVWQCPKCDAQWFGEPALASGPGDHAELAEIATRCEEHWLSGPQEEGAIGVVVRRAQLEALLAENAALRGACSKSNDEISQTLGKALGYPWFKDDQVNFPGATAENGVCVGDHVAESLADEAARRITEAERKLAEAVGLLQDVVSPGWTRDAWSKARSFLSKEAERG